MNDPEPFQGGLWNPERMQSTVSTTTPEPEDKIEDSQGADDKIEDSQGAGTHQ